MSYFILRRDQSFQNHLCIEINEETLKKKEVFITYCKFDQKTIVPDLFHIKKLFNYYFFISDKLKELVEIYDEDLEFIPLIITNTELNMQLVYWRVILPTSNFLTENKISKVEDICINRKLVKDKHIFLICFQKQEYICVSLYLAENMLRKFLLGIEYQEIYCDGDV